MKRIHDVLGSKGFEDFKDYFVDVEFNRRYSNQRKWALNDEVNFNAKYY